MLDTMGVRYCYECGNNNDLVGAVFTPSNINYKPHDVLVCKKHLKDSDTFEGFRGEYTKKPALSYKAQGDICPATLERGCATWEMANGDIACLDCGRVF